MSAGDLRAERVRHRVGEAGGEIGGRIDDRLLDERGEVAAVRLRRLLLQIVEIGPDLAVRTRRALEGVAAAAAVRLEDREPWRPAAACPPLFNQASNFGPVRIVTWLRISAWPRPQSSVQITGKVPVRVGVTTS